MSELKPCPFCGGVAEADSMQPYRAFDDGSIEDQAAVYCTQCNAGISFCYADAPGVDRDKIIAYVVDNWNQRYANHEEAIRQVRAKGEKENPHPPAVGVETVHPPMRPDLWTVLVRIESPKHPGVQCEFTNTFALEPTQEQVDAVIDGAPGAYRRWCREWLPKYHAEQMRKEQTR